MSRISLSTPAQVFILTIVIDTIVSFVVFPLSSHHMGAIDGEGYAKIASAMLECGSFAFGCEAHSTVFRGPGYPAFLALINLPFGGVQYEWTVLVQIFLNATSAALLFMLALRRYGLREARIAVLMFLCMPLLHVFVPRFHVENLLMLLVLGIVSLLARSEENTRFRHTIGAGLLLGIAILVKQTMLLLPLLLFIVLVRRMPSRIALPVLLLPLLIVLPWSIRSSIASDSFVPMHINGGMNLVIGNEVVRGFAEAPFEGQRLWFRGHAKCMQILSSPEPVTARDEATQDQELLKAGIAGLLQPEIFLLKLPVNLLLIFSLGTSPLNSALIGIPWLILLPLSLSGMRQRGDGYVRLLIASIILCIVTVHLPIYSIGRFAIPFAPLLLLFAAAGVTKVWKNRRL